MSPEQVLELVDDILTNHHIPLKAELATLGATLPADTATTFAELRQLLDGHLMKEETILFPNFQGLARGVPVEGYGLLGPIQQMRHEHAQLRALEVRLRADAQRGGPGAEALLALLDDLVIHANKEETILFPAAIALAGLPEPDWEELEADNEPPARARTVTPTPKKEKQPRRSLLGRIARKLRR
ncbi:MAG: iron-sulfur cluster repair protein YtfE (RIC family) [Myxococcota bacterium]|jgi:iron-sulfur cluster repair protein YtfE (RIC family)